MFFIIYGILSIKISAKEKGLCNIDNSIPIYATNGFKFWIFTILFTNFICYLNNNISTIFVNNFINFIQTSNYFGISIVSYLFFKDYRDYYNKYEDDSLNKYSILYKFFRGLKFHPYIMGNIDIKQLTNCRYGMILWQIIIILFHNYYIEKNGFNNSLFVNVLLQSIYIGKFFYWEFGYFNTLDITLDRAGYYICWGCIVFVPGFYTYSTYLIINNNNDISLFEAITILILGVYCICKNYEIDREKQIFKEYIKIKSNKKIISYSNLNENKNSQENNSLQENDSLQENIKLSKNIVNNVKLNKRININYLDAYDDENNYIGSLLVDGNWKEVRHINYSYEILLSGFWCLCGYRNGFFTFSYLLYIIILLLHRIKRDEIKCIKKYKNYYKRYCKIAKYRLIKYIF